MPLEKPAYGTPCNGCGICCQREICPLGEIVFQSAQAPCPALEAEGERFVCGLIAHPATYAPIRTAIHGVTAMREAARSGVVVDIGCDARLEDERSVSPPPEFARAMAKIERMSRSTRRMVLRLWGDPR